MLIVYRLVVTAVGLVLWYRLSFWKLYSEMLLDDLEKTTKERDFLKETVLSLHAKPIYVTLSEQQIETIAQLVAQRLEKPAPWVN